MSHAASIQRFGSRLAATTATVTSAIPLKNAAPLPRWIRIGFKYNDRLRA
jgi:hypothetical protein